jgi:N-acetylmuramoyl-L-alanine amidase
MARHNIAPANVVGHSDVAPVRKIDPGELFEWEVLARYGLALATPKPRIRLLHENPGAFFLSLERFGYDVADGRAAITAFQRRFRPRIIDGELDGEVGRSSSNCCSPAMPPRTTIAAATISRGKL